MWWNFLLTFWAKRKLNNRSATEVYQSLVQASRDRFLFEVVGVPDNPQGRFESLILHMFLLQRRLGAIESGGLLAQALMDRMSDDLDRSIREMGVGDLRVGKNVKSLFKMVNQRFYLYEGSLDKAEQMVTALGVVFSVGAQTQKSIEINLLNMYLASFARKLNEYSDTDIVEASFSFPVFQRSDLSKNG